MSNIIERHPGYTLLMTVIAAMTITWIVLTFVLDDNKINFYKAQVESANAQIESARAETENIKSVNSIYKARIDYLETENKKLEDLNNYYLDWISKSSSSLPALKAQLKNLAEENNKLQKQQNSQSYIPQDTTKVENIDSNNLKKYVADIRIRKSEAYRDEVTGLVVGVPNIYPGGEASLQITFPDNSVEKENRIFAGKAFSYKRNGTEYQLIIKKIQYVYDYVEIGIVEK